MNEPVPSSAYSASAGAAPVRSLLQEYGGIEGVQDEACLLGGGYRPHWRSLFAKLGDMGVSELSRRWQQSRRLMHENGIAYSAYGDPADRTRPWELDPLPLLITGAEWRPVAAGIIQRARLLNRLLADLYGPQETIKSGALPAAVLFQHPGYLRAFWGQNLGDRVGSNERAPREQHGYLHFYAADMARAPDGNWWVLGDRTEAPSGTGFALENRIVISGLLPEAFRSCRVERLAPYFLAVRETMRQLANRHRENPRVVLLSQGPGSNNYFEDAYLARYLGYTLVQGDDLAVRNNYALLKTLGGLLPVDVILRRPNSHDCDPLELAPNSLMGAAGLMQAARSGHVSVANAFGSGLVESPIFMAFLPKICELLLGEKLQLPAVTTWWCGDERSLPYVLDNLDGLVIRPAYRERGGQSDLARHLVSLPKDELAALIRTRPERYIAQEQIHRSTAPVLQTVASAAGGISVANESMSIKPAYFALRAFAVATADTYSVMPGALGRISHANDSCFASLISGEGSKDVWVLADRPVTHVTLLSDATTATSLRRSGAELPSRVADHVYWLGRNMERADANARLLRTLLQRMSSEMAFDDACELPTLLRVLAEQGQIEPGYMVDEIRERLPRLEAEFPRFVLDDTQAGSLRGTISQLFRVASAVRDRISVDSWRIIRRVDQAFRPTTGSLALADLLPMINEVIIDLAAISGMVMESMTRTHTWRFLDLGRRVERAVQTSSFVTIALGQPAQINATLLEAILETADSIMTYRSRYLSSLQLPAVLDLLLTDETNPRSVVYQLAAVASHVDALPRDAQPTEYAREQRLAMTALHTVRMIDIHAVADAHALGDAGPMIRALDAVLKMIPELSDAISHRYLIHAGPTHQLMDVQSNGLGLG